MNDVENNETPLVIIKYDLLGRLLALLFRLFGIYAGALIIVADLFLFMNVIGWLIFFVFMGRFMDILFFDRALLTRRYFMKKWYFLGFMKLDIGKLQCKKSASKFGGTLLFDEKGERGQNLLFNVDLLPIKREKLREVKEVLIALDVISKDDCSWID